MPPVKQERRNLNWLAWLMSCEVGSGRKVEVSITGGTRRGRVIACERDREHVPDPKDQGHTRSSLTFVLDTGDRIPLVTIYGVNRAL